MSSSSSSSLSSSPDFSGPCLKNGCYDVFLSFRGEDTRYGFTANLYHSLMDNQVYTFMDIKLVGKVINSLFEIIERSKIGVIVYSESFASSDWCLRELDMILQRMKRNKMLMIPIFYKVKVNELKRLTGNTGKYLDKHTQEHGHTTVKKWNDAVITLGHVSGLSYKDSYERDFIANVVKVVKEKLEEWEETVRSSIKPHGPAMGLDNKTELVDFLRGRFEKTSTIINRVDDDIMDALFGYVATNRKNPSPENKSPLNGPNLISRRQSGQIFILEMRKSQNIAVILKSLAISRKEILDALTQGQGLTVETLEKLNRINPTKEEAWEILNFIGDPTKLADAESFLFHILRAVPSAFTRFDAMLFKLNYEADISSLKASIDTVNEGCKELRTRPLFMNLLQAFFKATGTSSRGNGQAFNQLNALKKLADVKTTDGKTTLLHLVVEEMVRSEGRKCVLNRSTSVMCVNPEKEYMMLGLPIVGGLSQEMPNVKKAATINYYRFSGHCSVLWSRVSETRDLVSSSDDGLGFGTEMLGFLNRAESEMSDLMRQKNSVVELAISTIEYYQGRTSQEKGSNPLQLFVIISDFLNMVDQVCVEIARKCVEEEEEEEEEIVVAELVVRFPKLPPDFMSDKSNPDSL